MSQTRSEKRPALLSRIAFFALLFVVMAATLQIGQLSAQAAQAGLSWNAPGTNTDGTPASDLAGYKLYIGNASRNYQQTIDVGALTNYSVANLTDGATYYFAVTAYNSAGQESPYSAEAVKAFPAQTTSHIITASAGAGGSIAALNNTRVNTATSGSTSMTSVTVNHAASQSFSITPATGYATSDVKVNGVSVGKVASYTFSNVTADSSIQATFAAATSGTGSGSSFTINCGGSQYSDAAGAIYLADVNYSGGSAGTTSVAIAGTSDDLLYQTERWGASSYSIPMPNGNYNLTLKFAETYWSAAGKRVFDITVGGQTVVSNLDIFAKVGKDTAYDVVLPVSVTNGTLAISFVNKVDNAKICAIKVAPAAAAAPAGRVVFAASSGGAQYTDATGTVYQADLNFSGGSAGTTGVAINGTSDDVLYQSERWGASSYNIPLTNGNYNLTLKFAETYWSAAGKRLFDVVVGATTMVSNLDIFAKAGMNTAYDVVLPVTVSNGTLAIKFVNKVDNAKICAIKVTTR